MRTDIIFDENSFKRADDNFKNAEVISRPSVGFWKDVWMRLKKNKLAMVGLFIISILFLMSIIGPHITGFDYFSQDYKVKNMKPNAIHWFGTDYAGRDLFTRAWYGARISLFIGIMAATIDFLVGVIYGGIAGFKGSKVDTIMMRVGEVLYSIPYLLMVILLMVVMGSGIHTMIIAMTLTGWIPMSRLVRGQVLQLKEMEYVQASSIMGAGFFWNLRKHLIPNTMGPILVNVTLTVPQAIFAEATLSYLGLGVPAPMASWGTMASDGLEGLFVGNAYQLFFPAFLISLTMFAFNVLGDGMRDALDPKLKK